MSSVIAVVEPLRAKFFKAYQLLIGVIGIFIILKCIGLLFVQSVGVDAVLIGLFIIIFGHRLIVEIPRTKSNITINEPLLFLCFFMFGGPVMIIIAALEGSVTTYLMMKKAKAGNALYFIMMNLGILSISSAASYAVYYFYTGSWDVANSVKSLSLYNFLTLSLYLTLSQFGTNSIIISLGFSLRLKISLYRAWLTYCAPSFISFLLGVFAAAFLYTLVDIVGLLVFASVGLSAFLISTAYDHYTKVIIDSQQEVEDTKKMRMENANRQLIERTLISESVKISRERFRHAALHDGLTGLANRTFFMEQLNLLIGIKQKNPGFNYAVLYMDLNKFKQVNDTLGHTVGDLLLITVGQRLKNSVRRADTVTRLSGDEFAVLLHGLRDEEDAWDVSDRIRAAVVEPCTLDGNFLTPGTSIGIAYGKPEYRQIEQAVNVADEAMYKAKSMGGGCFMPDRVLLNA